jgi:hypothetical protein
MSGNSDKLARDQRLAAKLRENLRRRKSQAKAMESQPEALSKSDSDR